MKTIHTADRVRSVDLLRGITIIVMLFVNDIAGVTGTPLWLLHVQPPDADGLTFVDVVFPAFLFIVGMSVPLARRSRMSRGQSRAQDWSHALVRTVSLLVIGVFMVNAGAMGEGGPLPRPVWVLLMYAGVLLVWNRPPSSSRSFGALRWLGLALLVAAALFYRGSGEPALIELRTHWWGILGLIGWAYLVAFLVYDLTGPSRAALAAAVALLYLLYLGDAGGLFDALAAVDRLVDIGGTLGTHGAITVSGVLLGTILLPEEGLRESSRRVLFGLQYGLVLAAAAALLHAMAPFHEAFTYNKIAATPPWALLSAAVTAWVWVGLYLVVDVRGWQRWTPAVEPAGRNALFAYVLAPILYALFELPALLPGGANLYALMGSSFWVGLVRSLLFALSMTWLAGYLSEHGLRLRL